jgi:hypothetical protein
VLELLNQGHDINYFDHIDGMSNLHAAVEGNHLGVVQALLDCNQNVGLEKTNASGNTALDLAIMNGFEDIAIALIKAGADCEHRNSETGRMPLHLAALRGCKKIAEHLVNQARVTVDRKDNEGSTAFHYATKKGRNEIAVFLYMKGADKNATNKLGETPYSLADSALKEQLNKDPPLQTVTKSSSFAPPNRKGSNTPALEQVRKLEYHTLEFEVDSSGKRVSLGSGTFGEVFKARLFGALVAVKEFKNSQDVSKIEAEIVALRYQVAISVMYSKRATDPNSCSLSRSVSHPNVVQLLGYCMDPLCIVTEFLPGGNLEQYITAKKNNFPMDERKEIATEIVNGLSYLHYSKIVHRDLKTANLVRLGNAVQHGLLIVVFACSW